MGRSGTGTWRNFDADSLRSIMSQYQRLAPDTLVAAEVPCPDCGAPVRRYFYRGERSTGPTLIQYVWCGACRRYSGSTGPHPPQIVFDDPLLGLPEDQRQALLGSLKLFAELDRCWEQGRLPQTIARREATPQRKRRPPRGQG